MLFYAQVLEQTLGILQDGKKSELQKILELKGDEAQEQLDILQSIADSPRPLTPRGRFLTLKTIFCLSQESGQYPRCYVIKNLKLGPRIARGAFGDLYKATVEANGQDENVVPNDKFYAVKVVQLFPGSVDITDCLREAILWRQLKHPNVLPFLGMYYQDEIQQDVCFVSPYMDMGSLSVMLKNKPPADEDLYTLVHDIACGLTYLHGEKIIHGDLKDANVLISDGSRASLCDFGQSRLATATGFKSTKRQGGGTPGFIAPEVSKRGRTSNEGDVYAFGRLCFQILKKMYGLLDLRWLSEDSHEVDPTRPEGLPSRRDLDLIWDMILKCLDGKPSLRPDAKELVSLVDEMSPKKIIPPPDWDDLDPSFMRLRSNVDHGEMCLRSSLPANLSAPMTIHSAASVSLPDGGNSPMLLDRTTSPYLQPAQSLQNFPSHISVYTENPEKTQIDYQEIPPHYYQQHLSRNYKSSLGMALDYQYATGSRHRSPGDVRTGLSDTTGESMSSIAVPTAIIENTELPTAPTVYEQYPMEMALSNPPQSMQPSMTPTQPASHIPIQSCRTGTAVVGWQPNEHLPTSIIQTSFTQFPVPSEQASSAYQSQSFEPPVRNSQLSEWPSTPVQPPAFLSSLDSYVLMTRGSPPEFLSNLRTRTLKGLRHYSSEEELSRWDLMDVDTTENSPASATQAASDEGSEPPKKKKAFGCGYPGCHRTFTVKSNAKRHLRTHGINPDLFSSRPDWSIDFEDPQIVQEGGSGTTNLAAPSKIKWMPLPLSSRFNATSPSPTTRNSMPALVGGNGDWESDCEESESSLDEHHHHLWPMYTIRGGSVPVGDVQSYAPEITVGTLRLESPPRDVNVGFSCNGSSDSLGITELYYSGL
ncbi:hypothetical protein D9758_012009 [Tetrapyrgos nigripes]|uniref:Uncharacterized protein n=1 Tax=Tetrapyrgos nigripes TaxID=182062 RepID=A0A8H5CPN2_9AGAR|nr:hypothetical protein D9758_012009 [Tetrapyrgos nigripes]